MNTSKAVSTIAIFKSITNSTQWCMVKLFDGTRSHNYDDEGEQEVMLIVVKKKYK